MPLAGREFCRIRRRDARSEAIVTCWACSGIGTSCCQSLVAEAIQANIRDAGGCGVRTNGPFWSVNQKKTKTRPAESARRKLPRRRFIIRPVPMRMWQQSPHTPSPQAQASAFSNATLPSGLSRSGYLPSRKFFLSRLPPLPTSLHYRLASAFWAGD